MLSQVTIVCEHRLRDDKDQQIQQEPKPRRMGAGNL